MKIKRIIILLLITFFMIKCENKSTDNKTDQISVTPAQEFYQLKVYTFESDEQVITIDKYLEQAYLPGLKRLGINNIGVFKPRPNDTDTVQKIFILTPFTSLEQFLALEDELHKDIEYTSAGNDYINAVYDQPPYLRIESTLLKAFIDMPQMETPPLDGPISDRIYELRSYESSTEKYHKNKVAMFNEGGEIKLFKSLGFNTVFFAEVISGSNMPNLIYMTAFSNQENRDEHWKTFTESPQWKEMKSLPQYSNNVSNRDHFMLYPTEYSDY